MFAKEVLIEVGLVSVVGDLVVPDEPRGVVVFAHGSGSGRLSPRNRYVAEHLQRARLATLLMDLLTRDEEQEDRLTRHLRFDIGLLAQRLVRAGEWVRGVPELARAQVGYFGASTGAAAALVAAAHDPEWVGAVVSRGGRPDLAGSYLPKVRAPTLLVVGARDPEVRRLNEEALASLDAPAELVIVPGASHLFEEPGTLERAAELARDWFVRYLIPRSTQPGAGAAAH